MAGIQKGLTVTITNGDDQVTGIVFWHVQNTVTIVLDSPSPWLVSDPVTWYWTQPDTNTRWQQEGIVLKSGPGQSLIVQETAPPEGLEGRKEVRYSVRLPISLTTGPWPWDRLSAVTVDISENGLRYQVNSACPTETTLSAMITLPTQRVTAVLHPIRYEPQETGGFLVACTMSFPKPQGQHVWHDYLVSVPVSRL